MEIWIDVVGYEGLYQVSNLGNVKGLERLSKYNSRNNYKEYNTNRKVKEKLKKLSINKVGYCQTLLYKDGKKKNVLVHRLVAQAFIPNPKNKPTVNHIDGNRTNNNIDNLEWATYPEQQLHVNHILGKKSIISKQCREKRAEQLRKKVKRSDGKIYNSIREASKDSNAHGGNIVRCCKGTLNHAGGYSWEYV
jgi:hypothetical protein